MSDAVEALDRYLEQVQGLPPAPVVATQLLSLFSEADRDIDRIVELIGLDPSLTAEVLKRCNSAYMGFAQPIREIFEAVFQLGFYEVYCVVVGLVGSRSLSIVRTKGFQTDLLWQHSVATAAAAAILAKRVQETEAIGFTAGLLHDLGKLVLASVDGPAYASLTAASGSALVAAEELTYGFNHADIGARLLALWNLPENVCVAVLRHHSSSRAGERHSVLSAIVNLANHLAHQVVDDPKNSTAGSEYPADALALLPLLRPEDLPSALAETRDALDQVATALRR
jgi:putative nucleotidyltransferase with HDIG domain